VLPSRTAQSGGWRRAGLEEIKVPSDEDILLYLQEQRYWQETKNLKRETSGEKQSGMQSGSYALEDGALQRRTRLK